jgi:hypothetical protein
MREGEEGVINVEDMVEVTIVEEDDVVEVVVIEEEDDDDPVEVILVTDPSPPQPAYKQTTWIQIGPRGRPTGTLAPWTGAREASRISPEVRSEVWPLPPPPPPSGPITTAERRLDHCTATARSRHRK